MDSNNNLYTFGNEFMYETGVEYKGLYHKQSETNIFTEPVFNSKTSKRLVPFLDFTTSKYKYQKLVTIQTKYDSITPANIIITSSDIANKFILRYFFKKINDELIIETTKKSYDDWTASKIDPNIYMGIQIKWYIAGIVDNIFNFNLKIINSQINMPGLRNLLTDPLQYYTTTNQIIPTNINSPINSTS